MNYKELDYIHDNKGANSSIHIKLGYYPVKEINHYCKKEVTLPYCIQGCSNYNKNWSCPPNSPDFIEHASNYSSILLMLGYVSLDHFKLSDKNESVMLGYNLVKNFLLERIINLEESLKGVAIPGACCELCQSCPNKGCVKPDRMRYNFTSLGMQMAELSKDIFDHNLLWTKEEVIPEYISCFGGVLTNHPINNIL